MMTGAPAPTPPPNPPSGGAAVFGVLFGTLGAPGALGSRVGGVCADASRTLQASTTALVLKTHRHTRERDRQTRGHTPVLLIRPTSVTQHLVVVRRLRHARVVRVLSARGGTPATPSLLEMWGVGAEKEAYKRDGRNRRLAHRALRKANATAENRPERGIAVTAVRTSGVARGRDDPPRSRTSTPPLYFQPT